LLKGRTSLSKTRKIQDLVQNGLYYLTEHANVEAESDGCDIYDIERGVMSGRVRRTWPREDKYELVGKALDERAIGIVCRLTAGNKVRVITVYEDRPKSKP
jgi:hypothetical protein